MKLFYSKAACSMAVHITLEDLKFQYQAIRESFEKPSPEFLSYNPLGQVPVLVLDDGKTLTEVAAILTYLADLSKKNSAPGTFERYELSKWLNFIATELHKGFGPLFGAENMVKSEEAQNELHEFAKNQLGERFDLLDKHFSKQDFLLASGYSVADAYAYTVINWANFVDFNLSKWPSLVQYLDRISKREATIRVLKAEHLIRG